MGVSAPAHNIVTDPTLILSKTSLFQDLPDNTVSRFVEAGQVRSFSKGSVIFLQDDPANYFYIVLSGWVKLFRNTSEGEEAVIDMVNQGSIIGETAILEDDIYTFGASAADEVNVISLPTSLLKSLIKNDNKLALAMLTSLSKLRMRQTKELEGMTLKNASQRLGCFILRLCQESDKQDIALKFPYDKSLIAARLGMKSETFSRALNKLRRETDIKVEGSTIIIPEIDQLSHYACSACSNEFPCSDLH